MVLASAALAARCSFFLRCSVGGLDLARFRRHLARLLGTSSTAAGLMSPTWPVAPLSIVEDLDEVADGAPSLSAGATWVAVQELTHAEGDLQRCAVERDANPLAILNTCED